VFLVLGGLGQGGGDWVISCGAFFKNLKSYIASLFVRFFDDSFSRTVPAALVAKSRPSCTGSSYGIWQEEAVLCLMATKKDQQLGLDRNHIKMQLTRNTLNSVQCHTKQISTGVSRNYLGG
jgi:hypothetical protein